MAHFSDPPTVLAVDISSSGVSAAVLDSSLKLVRMHKESWAFDKNGKDSATLCPKNTLKCVSVAVQGAVDIIEPPKAMILSSMMHTLLIRDSSGVPKTPIFTWLDCQGASFIRDFVNETDIDIPERTGIQPHAMFPIFKLLWLRANNPQLFDEGDQFGSVKNYLLEYFIGESFEDTGTASSGGFLNIETGLWDSEILERAELSPLNMPKLVEPYDLVGQVRPDVADALSLPHGLPVIAGSGDGFLANLGIGGEGYDRIVITLGTTAAVRKLLDRPHVDKKAGTFCYRFDQPRYLLGCASNNGGNVIDWSEGTLGPIELDIEPSGGEPPLFVPFLQGERSPFWEEDLRARWYDIDSTHGIHDLQRAVIEGLAFHLALYTDLVDRVSGATSSLAVLSGNGFTTPFLASILAKVIPQQTLVPESPGLATLRGAARLAFATLDIETRNATERILQEATIPISFDDDRIEHRFERFKLHYWDTGKTLGYI